MSNTLYKIELAPAAERQLNKIPSAMQKTIINKLEKLESNPRPD